MILTEHDENDRFGYIWRAETENIHNPFMYAGEYHDDETGFIYLRNRYYDPDAKRFTQEDPIRDGLNWYAYCENNPVMFVDPLGWALSVPYYVNGDPRFDAVQKLTDDVLGYDTSSNLIYIVKHDSSPIREAGTNLIRELISNNIVCEIKYTTHNNSYMNPYYDSNGNLTSTEILYNPGLNFDVLVRTEEGNKLIPETNYIVMGHELIHFYNRCIGNMDNFPDNNGEFYDKKNKCYYKGGTYYVQDEKGNWNEKLEKIEELRTTGITSYRFWWDSDGVKHVNSVMPGKYTENMLRQEQIVPLPIRVEY